MYKQTEVQALDAVLTGIKEFCDQNKFTTAVSWMGDSPTLTLNHEDGRTFFHCNLFFEDKLSFRGITKRVTVGLDWGPSGCIALTFDPNTNAKKFVRYLENIIEDRAEYKKVLAKHCSKAKPPQP